MPVMVDSPPFNRKKRKERTQHTHIHPVCQSSPGLRSTTYVGSITYVPLSRSTLSLHTSHFHFHMYIVNGTKYFDIDSRRSEYVLRFAECESAALFARGCGSLQVAF